MPPPRKKTFLFVDDSADFLEAAKEVFTDLASGTWQVFTALNHAEALKVLGRERLDVVVLDVDMPVMDGVQFLQLILRAHPGQQVVMLSGHANGELRKKCLESGAVMFLDKLLTPEGYSSAFATLDALAGAKAGAGFQGMMRRVGLQEVLQLECLGRKSSILEVFTSGIRGRIFIHDGSIVHAESNNVSGEMALYGLLALQEGGFNLLPFSEPDERTINGQWEFLLMEAARLSDEGSVGALNEGPSPDEPEPMAPPQEIEQKTRIQEFVLFSGSGEVLHSWQSGQVEQRLALLRQVDAHARGISAVAPVGRLEQLETFQDDTRIVCQVRMDRLLVVASTIEVEGAE
jgi:CheY-like chemotaxis protein